MFDNKNISETFKFSKEFLKTYKLVPIANKLFFLKRKAEQHNDYDTAQFFEEMGHVISSFLTPDEYRSLDHWKNVSTITLTDMENCLLCSRPSEVAHHNKYCGVLFREVPGQDTIGLCRDCHESFHDRKKVANYFELNNIKKIN